MTRGERRVLLAVAIVLTVVCAVLFARAALAQWTADRARTQARAALFPTQKAPPQNFVERTVLGWSGATEQARYWQALRRFRVVGAQAREAAQLTLQPLSLLFKIEETSAYLRKVAAEDPSLARRSRLEDMLGLSYFYDAELHRGEIPVAPELQGRAIFAFRRAVRLDGSNNAAKTNLELLLQKLRQRQHKPVQVPQGHPDQLRALGAMQDSAGLASKNGAIGRHFSGGY